MRILLISTFGFDPNFPSRPEHVQARALAARGHRVVGYEYLSPAHPGQSVRHAWLPGGVAIHRCSTWGFFSPEALLRMILAERPDIVHIHHLRNLLAFQTVTLARRMGWPTVLTPHGLLHDGDLVVDRERPFEAPLRFEHLITRPQQLARRLLAGAHPRRAARNYLIHAPLRLIDGAVALSNHERGLLVALGIRSDRVAVLPNALDMSQFQATHAAAHVPFSRPLILFIGQLVYRKGFDILARAMPAVVRCFPGASFVFISHNRQEEPALRRLAAEGNVAAHLHLLGAVDESEKVRLLRSADVVAAPSRYEGFGIPLIEAMASGCPVITTDIPAGNEIVRHEQTGLLTPYDNSAALAEAIIRVVSDREYAGRLGARGRQEALERYGGEHLAAQLEAWYETIRGQVRSAIAREGIP